MPSKEELLNNIRPDMKLTKDFFKRIYGFEISYPGFANQAIAALEAAGCSKARQYYTDWVNEYQTARDAELKEVAHRYRFQCEREWEKRQKEGEERRKEQEVEQTKTDLRQKSDRELLISLQNLKTNRG